ncbi:MAG: hypothetical protein QUV05_09220 [Phycisphaerae bacterium]|nr:hypothetical protein [Phycisphaerae bacterium]
MPDAAASYRDQTATVVGIDEAGYGPLLGPLVVSATAFDVPLAVLKKAVDPADGPDLWKLLTDSVTRKASKRDPRLAVADSKKLHGKGGGKHGLLLLERAVLAFLMQVGDMPASLRELLRSFCPQVLGQLAGYPWYQGADVALPVDCGPDAVALQSNALRRSLAESGVRFRGAWVEVLPEGHFNRQVEATHNKAVVLFGRTTRLIQRVAESVGPRPLGVWVDRQGGRVGYRRPLMTAFEDAQLEVLEESTDRSGYRLNRRPAPLVVRFVKEGESHHLAIALASMMSKYVRELFMICFNQYWCSQVTGLRPTAGYYEDGQRFLADIKDAEVCRQLDRHMLVRDL